MKPVRTPRTTVVFVFQDPTIDPAIGGDLPVERVTPWISMSTWDLSPDERTAIAEGALVELYVVSSTPHPPVALEVSTEPRELPPQFRSETEAGSPDA